MRRSRYKSVARSLRWTVPVALVAVAAACAVNWQRKPEASQAVSPDASVSPTSQSATQPATGPSTAPAAAAHATLTVKVTNLRNRKGDLIFGVFRTAEGFPNKGKPSVFWQVKPAAGTAGDPADGVVFTATLPPGRYAASVLHDENQSGDMERGFGGIPKEGYGVTNNPKPALRAATFDEATFDLTAEGAGKTISVQYF